MTTTFRWIAAAACLVPASVWAQAKPAKAVGQARIEREVGHELTMVPQYGVFDHLAYQVNGDTVVLTGSASSSCHEDQC